MLLAGMRQIRSYKPWKSVVQCETCYGYEHGETPVTCLRKYLTTAIAAGLWMESKDDDP